MNFERMVNNNPELKDALDEFERVRNNKVGQTDYSNKTPSQIQSDVDFLGNLLGKR
jgi:predicted RNA-binding protein with EMAP domain